MLTFHLLVLLNIVNYYILDLDKFHFVDAPAQRRNSLWIIFVLIDGECRLLVAQEKKMHRKKVGKFLFIPSDLVVVVFLIALVNIVSAELHKSLPDKGKRYLNWCPLNQYL